MMVVNEDNVAAYR